MIPEQIPTNSIPWLIWLGRRGWHCEACGRAGSLPPMVSIAAFARALVDLKREHYRCAPGFVGPGPGEVGHPLNPDRVE